MEALQGRRQSSTQTIDPCSSYRHKGSCRNRHQKWSTYLQWFNLNIKYKKGSTNNIADCLSRPLIVAITTVLNSCGHETFDWLLLYKSDPELSYTYKALLGGMQVPNFHLQDTLLCHLWHLCVPSTEHAKLIWEAHYSRVTRNFGVEKIVAVLQKYFYWPNLQQDVGSTSNPALLAPLPNQPSRSKASILCYLPLVNLGNPSRSEERRVGKECLVCVSKLEIAPVEKKPIKIIMPTRVENGG